ncbi:MAG: DUF599 domain-containing protein [Candidatus Competibacterales bacterium]
MLDLVAFLWLMACWSGFELFTRLPHRRVGLSQVMNRIRHCWAMEILHRDNRVTDSGLLGNIMRGASFYASTSVLILLACLALLGTIEEARQLLERLPLAYTSPLWVWEVKIIFLALIFTFAFFVFTWALRQFNHCCALVGGLPVYRADDPQARRMAAGLGVIIALATSSLNLGLRAYYFGLATVMWLVHPLLVMVAASAILGLLVHRELFSHTRRVLLEQVIAESPAGE